MTHESAPQKVIEIGLWKAISIVSGSILVAIVGTAFTVGSILNSDHFLLTTVASEVDSISATYVRKDVYEVQQKQIIELLTELKNEIRK